MKKFLSLIGVVAFANVGFAELFNATEYIASGAVAGTNTTIVTNASPIRGRGVHLVTAATGGSATVTVYTVSGIGSSLGSAKTLLAATVVPPGGYFTNYCLLPPAPVLLDDKIVVRTDNASITSSVSSKTLLIVEE